MILSKIQNLPIDLIKYIYVFLTPSIRIFCNKKFDLLEEELNNEYKVWEKWKKCSEIFESLNNKQIMEIINCSYIKENDLIINKIWYHTNDKDNKIIYYKGEKVLELWKLGILDPGKSRLSDAIFYYILRTIQVYSILKKKILLNKVPDFQSIQNAITNIDKSFYIYKTMIYIRSNLHNFNL